MKRNITRSNAHSPRALAREIIRNYTPRLETNHGQSIAGITIVTPFL